MLVLTRRVGEKIVIGPDVTVEVVEVRGEKVRLGITAPREVPVHRSEVKDKIDALAKLAERSLQSSNPEAGK